MTKQKDFVNNHFSSANNSSLLSRFILKSKRELFGGGFIKAILMIVLVCCLQVLGNGEQTSDNADSTKQSSVASAVEKTSFDFDKTLELYSTYALDYRVFSRYIPVNYARELFKRVESAEQIEQLLKNYDGKSIKIPYDLKLDIIVEDDYDTNGIGFVFTMPFRCYVKPLDTDKKIKRVDLNNTTTPFLINPYSDMALYIKNPADELILVDFFSIPAVRRTEYYDSSYVKEYPYCTKLRIMYLDSEDVMKELYKNKEKYAVQVEVKNLAFSRPKTIGLFKLKDLIDNNVNTTPLYDNPSSYIPNKIKDDFRFNPPQKALFAVMESVSIVNIETKKEILKIKFDSDCKIPESLEMNNNVSFQSKPVEDLSKVTIKECPPLRSVLPENDKDDRVQIFQLRDYISGLDRDYEKADVFDKKSIKKKLDDFKELIVTKEFQEKFKLTTVFVPNDFNKNIVRLFIQTPTTFRFDDNGSFEYHNINKITFSDYDNKHYNLWDRTSCSTLQYLGDYFYTSKKTLAPIKSSGCSSTLLRLKGGILYREEELNTTLILDVIASLDDMKDIYNNHDDYEVVVTYNNLRQEILPFWGYFNEEALLAVDGNTKLLRLLELSMDKEHIPFYFVTRVRKDNNPASNFTVFKASIKSIYVVNKNTKKIIAKADAKELKKD